MATVSLAIATTTSTLGYPPKSHPPTAGLRPACAGFAGEKRRVGDPAQKAGDPKGIPGGPLGPGDPGIPGGTSRDPGFFRGEKSGISLLFFSSKSGIFGGQKSRDFDMKNKRGNRDFWPLGNP